MSRIIAESKLLARHSSVYAVGVILQRVAAIALLPLYTSYLTPRDYGIKEMVALTTDVVQILVATAISSAVYRFYFEQKDEDGRRAVMSTAYLTLAAIGAVMVAALWAFTRPLAGLMLDDPGLSHYLTISFVALWFQALTSISFSYLRARQKSVQTVAMSLLQLLIMIALNIWFIVGLDLGVLGILLSTLIAAVIMFLILTLPQILKLGLRFDRRVLKDMLGYGLPMIPAQLGGTIVHVSDRFFIKSYVSLAETGIYSLAYRFGTMPSQFISQPFNQTWMPRRFEIAKDPDSEHIFGRIFTWFLALIVLAGLAIASLSRDLLQVIADEKFWSASRLIPVIVLANIVFTFHYHFNIGILLEKRTKYIAWINLTNAALVIGLNFLLIPRWGGMGAAVATLLSFVFKSGLTFVIGRRFYRTHFEFLRVAKILVAAAATYGALSLVTLGSPLMDFAVRAMLLAALYPSLLLALRFLTDSERAKIREKGAALWRRVGRRS